MQIGVKFSVGLLLIASLSLAGCGGSKESGTPSESNSKLLTAEVWVEKPDAAPDYSQYFVYDDGYLVSASGFTGLHASYSYDGDGKLISSISQQGESYVYSYDSMGRMVKSVNEDNGEEIDFVFGDRKVDVVWKRSSAVIGSDDFYFDSRELILDDLGRIVVINNTTPNDDTFDLKQEFIYDDKGNIIKATFVRPSGESYVQDYVYFDIKDPYYSSYRKLFQSAYYFMNFFDIAPTIRDLGLSPYVMDQSQFDDIDEYSIDGSGYPSLRVYHDFIVRFDYE